MDKEQLGKEIYEISNVEGEFLLRSGITATEYFDKYLFESNPRVLKAIAEHLKDLLPPSFDKLAGLEMGGIPIATALSLVTEREVLFVRKEAKEYGTCKLAEGGDIAGKHLVIVEDVVTSGGAIIDAVNALRARGAIVNQVLCVIDRECTASENLKALGLQLRPLFTKSELEYVSGG
ncbi:orotate phosphoribosyltransferase [Photobacterium kagoshimensis]|uniref:orotate phosphoribosyltransferase n=1 Tax=Photobacterium kagoshimensis TaxID=2910242 RepID=UPI003D0DCD27